MKIFFGAHTVTHQAVASLTTAMLAAVEDVLRKDNPVEYQRQGGREAFSLLAGLQKGQAEGMTALEQRLAERDATITSLRAQLAEATAPPPDTVMATVKRSIRDSQTHLIDAVVESREYVPASMLTPLAGN